MKSETVTSAQNPKIKELLALQEKSRLRRERGLFVVEGRRELGHCIEAGYRVRTIFVCREIIPDTEAEAIIRKAEAVLHEYHDGHRQAHGETQETDALQKHPEYTGRKGQSDGLLVIDIPSALYDKIAYRGGTEGIIAEVEWKDLSLDGLHLTGNPLIMVLESVEKPGNLGAVLRSADAAGADAVIICDPLTDLYNPNLIRASIGAVFTTRTVVSTSEETIGWLKSHGIRILTAQLQDSRPYYDTDMTCGTAIVMGTESTGLTDIWRENADAHIRIPMLGRLDSLNVSVSAAILLYEAVRQRKSADIMLE